MVVLLVLMNGGAQTQAARKSAPTQEDIGSGRKTAGAIGAMPPAPKTFCCSRTQKMAKHKPNTMEVQGLAAEKGGMMLVEGVVFAF